MRVPSVTSLSHNVTMTLTGVAVTASLRFCSLQWDGLNAVDTGLLGECSIGAIRTLKVARSSIMHHDRSASISELR
ncbi:hypothetical protein AB1N83_003256 [Pleurotus pulmonarius]